MTPEEQQRCAQEVQQVINEANLGFSDPNKILTSMRLHLRVANNRFNATHVATPWYQVVQLRDGQSSKFVFHADRPATILHIEHLVATMSSSNTGVGANNDVIIRLPGLQK